MDKKSQDSLYSLFLGNHDDTSLEGRIFNAIIGASCLVFFLTGVFNAVFMGFWDVVTSAIGSFLFGILYWYSRKTGNYRPFILPISIACLALCSIEWVKNAGTNSSVGYYLVVLMVGSVIVLERKYRKFFVILLFSIVTLLLVWEYLNPLSNTTLDTIGKLKRFGDFSTTIIICLIFVSSMVYIVIEQHRHDFEKLKKAMDEIKTLRGFLPICAQCKKIRDGKGYWDQIESYIQSHADVEFSHSLCPDCIKELYGESFSEKIKSKKTAVIKTISN